LKEFQYFILIIFLPAFLNAQNTGSISGRVIDEITKKPLTGTNVLVEETNLGAATDIKGEFSIENLPVGTYRLQFNFIGYEPFFKTDIVVKSARPTYVNVQMRQSTVEVEKVRVTAGYFAKEETTRPSVIGLSQEEIRRFPGGFEDVVRTVSTLPGVAINMTAGRNDLLVRGGGPSENLYIINNIEVPNINHFGTQGNTGGSLSFVNLDFVEDVSFSTGGFGAEYGDKMSSVIALKMIKDKPEAIESKLTVSATQYGFDVDLPLSDRGNLIFSARKSYLDLIFKAAGLPFIPVYTDFNVLTNVDLSPKDQLFVLGLSAINNIDRNQSTIENRVFNAGVMDNTQYKGITGLNYRRLLKKGYLDLTLNMNLSRYHFSQIDENEKEFFKSDADEWEYGLKVQHTWAASKTLLIKSGTSVQFIRNKNTTVFADTIYDRSGNRIPVSQLGIPKETRIDQTTQKEALFISGDWSPGPRWNLEAGLRADWYNFLNNPLSLAPRAAIKFKIHPKHSLKLSSGLYTQSPAYIWTINPENRNLEILQNTMGVLGYDFLIRNDLRLAIEGYIKNYKNLPSGATPDVNDFIVITNTGVSYGGREDDFTSFGYFPLTSEGKGKAFGFEMLLQKKYSEIPLYGLISFAIGKGEFTSTNGRTVPGQYDQRFIMNISGGYIFNDKWEISAKFRYFTGIPYTPVYRPSENPVNPGTVQNLPEEYLTARLKPGHHLDLRVDRYFNFKKITLIVYVDIQNVYNYKIPMIPQYDFWEDKITDTSDIGILPSIGISLEL
jgi:hypothetical protein